VPSEGVPMSNAARALILFLAAGFCASASAQCRDTPIKRVPSPDGALAVELYHRECTSITYTAAEMRTPPTTLLPEGDEVCQLVTLRGRLKIEAVWKDSKHVLISSPDLLEWDLGISSQQDSCNDIKISYDLNVEEAPPEESPDPKVEAAIRAAVELAAPCLMDRHHPEHPEVFYCELEGGSHRSALSLLLTNLYDYRCPVSREAYSRMKLAAAALRIDREELEQLRPQVTTLARATEIINEIRREAAAARTRVRRRPPDEGGGAAPKLFGAWLDNQRVFIDSEARLAVEPQVGGEIEEFSDGMAKVSVSSGDLVAPTRYGYMDTAGRVVIPPRFERVSDFYEGLAWAEEKMWLDGPLQLRGRLLGGARVGAHARRQGGLHRQDRGVRHRPRQVRPVGRFQLLRGAGGGPSQTPGGLHRQDGPHGHTATVLPRAPVCRRHGARRV